MVWPMDRTLETLGLGVLANDCNEMKSTGEVIILTLYVARNCESLDEYFHQGFR